MKKKTALQSAFLNPRTLIGMLFLAGLLLGLFAFDLFPGAAARAQGSKQHAKSGPLHKVSVTDPQLVQTLKSQGVAQVVNQPHQTIWRSVDEDSFDQSAKHQIVLMAYRTVRLDTAALEHTLAAAPMEFARPRDQNPIVSLPMPDGTMQRFRFEESPIMEPGLAAKYPAFKTYRAQGLDDPTATNMDGNRRPNHDARKTIAPKPLRIEERPERLEHLSPSPPFPLA